MRIYVVAGKGYGKTPLSAFDAALFDAGIHNYNIIPLSSIIPPNTEVINVSRYVAPNGEYGHRLYVVKAEIRSDHPGYVLGAGLGWYQIAKDQRGVFVEHKLAGRDEEGVEKDIAERIKKSIYDLSDIREFPFDEKGINMKINTIRVPEDQAASVLVMAVYQAEGWRK